MSLIGDDDFLGETGTPAPFQLCGCIDESQNLQRQNKSDHGIIPSAII